MTTLGNKWIFLRNNEVRMIFNNRKEAIKYFKDLLKQTLKDINKQDKTDECDYEIEIPLMQFREVNERSADLSLI